MDAGTKSSEHKRSDSKASDAPRRSQKSSGGGDSARAKSPDPQPPDLHAADARVAQSTGPTTLLVPESEAGQMSPVTPREDALLMEGSPVSQVGMRASQFMKPSHVCMRM